MPHARSSGRWYLNGRKAEEATEARRILARLDGTPPGDKRRVAVRNIRHWTGKKYTRIVIDMDEEVEYRQGLLTKPDRIYFDLLESRLSQELAARTVPIEDGFLRQIRVGQNKPDVVRVVLDFESISRYNVFSLPEPYRLVVDILGIKPSTEPAVAPTAVPGRRSAKLDSNLQDSRHSPYPQSPKSAGRSTRRTGALQSIFRRLSRPTRLRTAGFLWPASSDSRLGGLSSIRVTAVTIPEPWDVV